MIADIDKDGNGTIDFEEFLRRAARAPRSPGQASGWGAARCARRDALTPPARCSMMTAKMGERDSREEILKGAAPKRARAALETAGQPALRPCLPLTFCVVSLAFRLFDDEGKVRATRGAAHPRHAFFYAPPPLPPAGHNHVQEPEARGQGARREHDGRGAPGDD